MRCNFQEYISSLSGDSCLRCKVVLFLLLVFLLVCGGMPAVAALNPWNGGMNSSWYNAELTLGHDGSAANPFCIYDAESFAAFAQEVNNGKTFAGKKILLCTDIDLANKPWTPIGTLAKPFSGDFEGNRHMITNLFVSEKNTNGNLHVGLFGCTQGASIRNTHLRDVQVSGTASGYCCIGALIGYGQNTSVNTCSASHGTVTADATSTCIIGGLIGETRALKATEEAVATSFATVDVNGTTTNGWLICGGLIGKNGGRIDVRNSYAIGNLWAHSASSSYSGAAGGLIGQCSLGGTGKQQISSCYAAGNVTIFCPDVSSQVTGLIGASQNVELRNCMGLSRGIEKSGKNHNNAARLIIAGAEDKISNCYGGRWMDIISNGTRIYPVTPGPSSDNGESVTFSKQVLCNEKFFRKVFSSDNYDQYWKLSEDPTYPYPVLKDAPEPGLSGESLIPWYHITPKTTNNNFTGNFTRVPNNPHGVMDGDDVTITPDIGSLFSHLTDNGKDVTSNVIDGTTYRILDISDDHVLEATYTKDTKYAVTVTNGTLANGKNSYVFYPRQTVTITANETVGGVFAAWNVTGITLGSGEISNKNVTFTMPRGAVTFEATYTEDTKYSVTVTNGTLAGGKTSGTFYPGEKITITANETVGGVFAAWNVTGITLGSGEISNKNVTFTMPRGAVTVEAAYTEDTKYSVTVTNGTLADGNTSRTFYPGESVTVTANEMVGSVFAAWNATGITPDPGDLARKSITFTMPRGAVTLEATYTGNVTPIPTGTGNVTPTPTGTGNVTPTPTGTGNVIPTPTGTGNVTPTPTGTGNITTTQTSTGSVTPAPHHTTAGSGDGNMNNAFRVLFDTQGGTAIPPETGLSYGDTVTRPFPSPTKDCYIFAGWYQEPGCTNRWNFAAPVPGDITLYAKWIKIQTTSPTELPTTKATEKITTAKTTVATTVPTTIQTTRPTLKQIPFPLAGLALSLLVVGFLGGRRRT